MSEFSDIVMRFLIGVPIILIILGVLVAIDGEKEWKRIFILMKGEQMEEKKCIPKCETCKYHPNAERYYYDDDIVFCFDWCWYISKRDGFCSEYKENTIEQNPNAHNYMKWIGNHDEYTCPVCATISKHPSSLNFCPNCGVRLIGVVEVKGEDNE